MTPLQSDERLHESIRAAADLARLELPKRPVYFFSLSPGDGTKYEVCLMRQNGKLYCAVPNFVYSGGNGLWAYTEWAHASYVEEKQHIHSTSAAVVADLINLVGGFELAEKGVIHDGE